VLLPIENAEALKVQRKRARNLIIVDAVQCFEGEIRNEVE